MYNIKYIYILIIIYLFFTNYIIIDVLALNKKDCDYYIKYNSYHENALLMKYCDELLNNNKINIYTEHLKDYCRSIKVLYNKYKTILPICNNNEKFYIVDKLIKYL